MADHLAEQIMDALVTTVTGLTTTGTNVVRDRPYPFGPSVTAALSIYQGDDNPVIQDNENWFYNDHVLDVEIDIHVKVVSTTPYSQTLNLIKKEIVSAIQANPTLGLSEVIDTKEGPALKPIQDPTGETPTAVQTFLWTVKYRRSRTDPSQ